MSSSRVAFFKNVNQAVVDADQVSALASLSNSLSSLSTVVGTKADSATVTGALALKADSQTVNSALALKADSQTVNSALALKASVDDISTINNTLGQVNTSLNDKVSSGVHTARVVAENAFITAFKEAINLSNSTNTGEFDYTDVLGVVAP